MSTFSWIQEEQELSPVALTVRAQTISPNDQGRLSWDIFFPRRNVDSVDLKDITTLDRRPAADRREWNTRGRYIPLLTPAQREMSMVPIEGYDKIEEKELQKLAEQTRGNDAIIQRVIGSSIPERTDTLVEADYRRLELDAMSAWGNGYIRQFNPQQGAYYQASFGFSNTRLTTAGTAWNDAGISAWDAFLTWVAAGVDLVGPIDGALMRQATFNAILADAPDLPNGASAVAGDLASLATRQLGFDFRFVINENSVDVFDDGGTAVTRTKVWTAHKVAAIPAGNQVGVSAFAPVRRAMELSNQVPEAGIDVRGVTVYHEEGNGGRELTIEAQLNAMPIPDEQRVYVIDAGV
jgi:Phage major capsid protein E